MASSAGRCETIPGAVLVAAGVFGCARADSNTSPPKAAINRRLDLLFIFCNDELGFVGWSRLTGEFWICLRDDGVRLCHHRFSRIAPRHRRNRRSVHRRERMPTRQNDQTGLFSRCTALRMVCARFRMSCFVTGKPLQLKLFHRQQLKARLTAAGAQPCRLVAASTACRSLDTASCLVIF
jgi:hypothetical protein